MTAAIARMNLVLHGVEGFAIVLVYVGSLFDPLEPFEPGQLGILDRDGHPNPHKLASFLLAT